MKLTLETEHEIYSVEFKNTDVEIEQIMTSIAAFLITCGFSWETIIEGINEYVESNEITE